jgi:hypothetical protein
MLEDARRHIDDVLNQIKPDDALVSSLALGVQGCILYFDSEFKAAVDVLRKSIGENNENFSSHFNLACCACKLADEIEAKGGEKTEIVTLENEALSSLLLAVKIQPWRKPTARSEGNTGDMKRIHEHPQFKLLISD